MEKNENQLEINYLAIYAEQITFEMKRDKYIKFDLKIK